MTKIDWTAEPFSSILTEFKEQIEEQVRLRRKDTFEYTFIVSESMTYFSTLTVEQHKIIGGVRMLIPRKDMER